MTRNHRTVGVAVFSVLVTALMGCSSANKHLRSFSDGQEKKISERSIGREAEMIFTAAVYEPTREDLEALRQAWGQHSKAFPESKAIKEVEKVVYAAGERALLVALYTSDIDHAELTSKSQGWTVHPVPQHVKELDERDTVLRTLMPVRNAWARYFLLRYTNAVWTDAPVVTVAQPEASVELERKNQ